MAEKTPLTAPFRFIALFAIYLGVGVASMAIPWVGAEVIDPWTRLNAGASAGITDLLGFATTVDGTLVHSGAATLQVLDGCNGAHALLILLSAILAFPAPWPRRVAGALIGTLAIFGFNLIRLVNLILVARLWPARLELFHIYIWQTLIVLIAFSLFLTWAQLYGQRPAMPAGDAA